MKWEDKDLMLVCKNGILVQQEGQREFSHRKGKR